MAKSVITGTRRMIGHKVSHSNIKTKRWQFPNLQERRLFVPELNRHVRLMVSTRDLRTIDKIGLAAYAQKAGLSLAEIT
ncbi:MAG: 50S ribosomal protein L28 [Deltaproteobacteria bacterium]|nr:50S ribosomal protein L28 [Deltaproteobacteria bacterium]